MTRLLSLGLVLGVLAAPAPVIAAVIYDNGSPNGVSTNLDGFVYILADDFLLDSDAWITGTDWLGELYLILDSAGPTVGALLASGALAPDGSLDSPFFATAGHRYWLAVFDGSLSDPCSIDQSVQHTALKGQYPQALSHPSGIGSDIATPEACEAIKGDPYKLTGGFWAEEDYEKLVLPSESDTDRDIAFALYGRAVPEPASLALLGVAVGCAAGRRRMNRRR